MPIASVTPATRPPIDGDSARLSPAAIRAFENIARAWRLTVDEQLRLLGAPARSTYFAWRKHPDQARLSRDTLERISYVLGIYKALQILLPDPAAADGWVRQPNDAPPFGGQPALTLMLGGNVADLHAVRRYLDAARGAGWN
ncbi:MAG: MbcA/ParS/Xre antitoxin family protein [Burkholderiaceae bacterium]